jgi:hypothetical protein
MSATTAPPSAASSSSRSIPSMSATRPAPICRCRCIWPAEQPWPPCGRLVASKACASKCWWWARPAVLVAYPWAMTAAKHSGHFSTKHAASQSSSSTSSRSTVIPQATLPVAVSTACVGPTGALLANLKIPSGRWARPEPAPPARTTGPCTAGWWPAPSARRRGAIHDAGRRPASSSSCRWRASAASLGAALGPAQASGAPCAQ